MGRFCVLMFNGWITVCCDNAVLWKFVNKFSKIDSIQSPTASHVHYPVRDDLARCHSIRFDTWESPLSLALRYGCGLRLPARGPRESRQAGGAPVMPGSIANVQLGPGCLFIPPDDTGLLTQGAARSLLVSPFVFPFGSAVKRALCARPVSLAGALSLGLTQCTQCVR